MKLKHFLEWNWLKANKISVVPLRNCGKHFFEWNWLKANKIFIVTLRNYGIAGQPKSITNPPTPHIRQSLPRSGKDTRPWQFDESAIGQHLLDNAQCALHYSKDIFSVLARARTSFHLSALEATFIKSLNPLLCEQKEFVYSLKISLTSWTFHWLTVPAFRRGPNYIFNQWQLAVSYLLNPFLLATALTNEISSFLYINQLGSISTSFWRYPLKSVRRKALGWISYRSIASILSPLSKKQSYS